jgi:hypothetical protein
MKSEKGRNNYVRGKASDRGLETRSRPAESRQKERNRRSQLRELMRKIGVGEEARMDGKNKIDYKL